MTGALSSSPLAQPTSVVAPTTKSQQWLAGVARQVGYPGDQKFLSSRPQPPGALSPPKDRADVTGTTTALWSVDRETSSYSVSPSPHLWTL